MDRGGSLSHAAQDSQRPSRHQSGLNSRKLLDALGGSQDQGAKAAWDLRKSQVPREPTCLPSFTLWTLPHGNSDLAPLPTFFPTICPPAPGLSRTPFPTVPRSSGQEGKECISKNLQGSSSGRPCSPKASTRCIQVLAHEVSLQVAACLPMWFSPQKGGFVTVGPHVPIWPWQRAPGGLRREASGCSQVI